MKSTLIIMIVLTAIVLSVAAIGCSVNNSMKKVDVGDNCSVERFKFISIGSYRIIIDNETGVEYLQFINGSSTAITPIYNADGSLRVYEGEE